MYLSYYKRPELMLLDKTSCSEFKKPKNVSTFFHHILNTEACVYFSGEEEKDDRETNRQREALGTILRTWVSNDYFARMPMKTYYISDTFYQALRKSFDKLSPLLDEDGLLASLHEDCCLIWSDTTYFLWRDPADDVGHCMLAVVNGAVAFFSSYTFGADRIDSSHTMSFMHLHDFGNDDRRFIESVYAFLLFKKYADVNIETITAKKTIRRSQILGEKVNNFMGIDVQVLDSRWFTTICRDEGFLVSGHVRLQPCKDEQGEWTRKLIYINPYAKHGYHRLAPIVNISNGSEKGGNE